MSKKTKPLPTKILSPLEVHQFIERDPCVHMVVLSLLAGRPWATTRFPMYQGYITKLRLAYDKEDMGEFLRILTIYFAAAYTLIPNIPNPENGNYAVQQIGDLIKKYGVRQVGKCILARMLG